MPFILPLTKRIVAGVICHPLVGRGLAVAYGRIMPFRGVRVHAPDDLVGGAQQATLFWGIYESTEARYVERHLDRTRDVIEVGASIGAVGSLIRAHLNPDRQLVSVEANPTLAALAAENLARNARGTPFTVVNRAIDYTHGGEGFVRFARRGYNLHGAIEGTQGHTADRDSFEVERTTLSALAHEFGIEDYTLVADIEGAEAGFIFGPLEALRGCQQILIELHDTTWEGARWTVQDFIDRLQASGFTLCHRYGPVCHFRRT